MHEKALYLLASTFTGSISAITWLTQIGEVFKVASSAGSLVVIGITVFKFYEERKTKNKPTK